MPNRIGVNPDFDCLIDPQMAKPVCFCCRCGGEVYTAGEELCWECREGNHD